MFPSIRKVASFIPRNIRGFSSTIDSWLNQPLSRPMQEPVTMNGDALEKLMSTLGVAPEMNTWLCNSASGVHPAFMWCMPSRMTTDDLSSDGYQDNVIAMPPAPFTSRMWGGGTIDYGKPLNVFQVVTKAYGLQKPPVLKHGKSGSFVTYTKQTEYADPKDFDSEPYAVETTNYIFRDSSNKLAVKPLGDGSAPQKPFDWECASIPELNELTLFRYSAVTWNAHRIHYDPDYAKKEGYDGVLVHGPLQATLLLDFCGQVSESLAGEEHALSKKLREELEKVAEPQGGHHHHHHNGEACDGNHGAANVPDVLWHARYQKLSRFEYKALQPLIANTPVRIFAKKLTDEHVTKEHPNRYRDVLRNGDATVALWIQDARDPATIYMEGVATFIPREEVTYEGVEERVLDMLV